MRKRQAFTVIELVITIIVVAIISTSAYVSISNSQKSLKLRAAAEKIAFDLGYTRNLALSAAKWYGISFAANPTNTYTIYETDGATDTTIVNPARRGEPFVVDISADFNNTIIQSCDLAGGSKIEFSPLGVPYDDKAGTALATTGEVVVSYSGMTRTIRVDANTARIIVQ